MAPAPLFLEIQEINKNLEQLIKIQTAQLALMSAFLKNDRQNLLQSLRGAEALLSGPPNQQGE